MDKVLEKRCASTAELRKGAKDTAFAGAAQIGDRSVNPSSYDLVFDAEK
jgi:hypothetical protein